MRSDSIVANNPRAIVLVAPPSADPRTYTRPPQANGTNNPARSNGQRWQRGGRGRRRGGAAINGGGGGMDVD